MAELRPVWHQSVFTHSGSLLLQGPLGWPWEAQSSPRVQGPCGRSPRQRLQLGKAAFLHVVKKGRADAAQPTCLLVT